MSLSLGESQAFLSKQAQLWQSQGSGLNESCQELQGLRDEEAQAVLQLEAEKAVSFLQQQLAVWSRAAKGQLVGFAYAATKVVVRLEPAMLTWIDTEAVQMPLCRMQMLKFQGRVCQLQSPRTFVRGADALHMHAYDGHLTSKSCTALVCKSSVVKTLHGSS